MDHAFAERIAARPGEHGVTVALGHPDPNRKPALQRRHLYVTNTKESQPRKLVTVDGTVFNPRFSPDGHRIRFDVMDPRNGIQCVVGNESRRQRSAAAAPWSEPYPTRMLR